MKLTLIKRNLKIYSASFVNSMVNEFSWSSHRKQVRHFME